MAGWQYLQQPEPIAAELWRITRPRGQVIVAFSNRMFFTKAPQVWTMVMTVITCVTSLRC